MTTSAAVRQKLVDLWKPLFPAALVIRGGRYTAVGGELLVVGDVDGDDSSEVLNGPARPIDETYEITCTASVTWNGSVDDQPRVEDRCQAIVTAARVAVLQQSDRTLGVPGVFWVIPRGRFQLRNGAASETKGQINTQIEFRLQVKARYRLT